MSDEVREPVTREVWPGAWVADRLGVELGGDVRDLVGLALRRNPKRAHLLVSEILGKHVPQRPRVVYDAGLRLGHRVRDLLGEVGAQGAVVLGYAETATGLGHAVADGLGTAVYLHSTRRVVTAAQQAGAFEETHSHATGHLLLPEDPDLLGSGGPLVLVDDELSTGNTIRNTVRALHARFPREHYVVVALVDMRAAVDQQALDTLAAELGVRVDVAALAAGSVQLPDDVLEKGRSLVEQHDHPGEHAGIPRQRNHEGHVAPRASEAAVAHPAATRVDLGWPTGVPDGGRHGFTPTHRARLEAALPDMATRLAKALETSGIFDTHTASTPPRVLVLGCEELMYAPLRLAHATEELLGDRARVRFSTTTRSPVLAIDDPAYAIRTRLTFPAHDDPTDGEGARHVYNVAPGNDPRRRFDAIVVVADSEADTPALHAPGGLLTQLTPHTDAVLLAVVPTRLPLPRPLRGPTFSSYGPDEVGWLLQDLSEVKLEAPTEEREEAVQSGGAHYAESLPVEYQPSAEYQELFHTALTASATRIARAVGTVTETLLAERGHGAVLASLARAGTPIGVLMRRWAQHAHGLDIPHYAVSIVRGRGIDTTALRYLATHHDPAHVVFVDGWTGKGAITRELAEALAPLDGFDPAIAVLADPGGCVRTYGTREDFLIPSACLNSTVSGLVSRTVLRSDLVGPHDFHGGKFYRDLAPADLSQHFLDTVTSRFETVRQDIARDVRALLAADPASRAPTWEGWRAVERVSEEYGIHDMNLVKPGVGETTRVLLRRVPWRIITRRGAGSDLDHVRLLAEQRGVPVEETEDLPYSCVGLIHPHYTKGATGADGKAVK